MSAGASFSLALLPHMQAPPLTIFHEKLLHDCCSVGSVAMLNIGLLRFSYPYASYPVYVLPGVVFLLSSVTLSFFSLEHDVKNWQNPGDYVLTERIICGIVTKIYGETKGTLELLSQDLIVYTILLASVLHLL